MRRGLAYLSLTSHRTEAREALEGPAFAGFPHSSGISSLQDHPWKASADRLRGSLPHWSLLAIHSILGSLLALFTACCVHRKDSSQVTVNTVTCEESFLF